MRTSPCAASIATQVARPSGPNFGRKASPSSRSALSAIRVRLDFSGEGPYIRATRFGASVHRMIDDIYSQKVLELAANIPRLGRLPAPDASAKAVSRLCGSTVVVDIKVDGDRVVDFAHDVK